MNRFNMTPVWTAAVLIVLLFTSIQPAVEPSPIIEPDWGRLDPYLQEMMGRALPGDRLDVIVQFVGQVTPADRSQLAALGLDAKHEFHVVPAIWTSGTAEQVMRLAGYPRTFWVEYNERLQYAMDKTTTVINATTAWDSIIEGSLFGNSGIDGTGVTAVVLDSGIDAGHPDLDYGTKTIHNLKSDSGVGPWYEVENSDTSSGHGTHVAGTVAGNGDASAGQRRGVAPGANLIGLSTGELVMILNALGGLEWVYDNSRPGNNPLNIRVVSNSWGGGGGQYNPQDSISQAINKLVYENNVAVCFAAGNSGGTGDDIQASNYGNTPAAVCVAAADHEGVGITDFSSKGQWDWVDTWPDIAAPGLDIWSTAARRTMISTMSRGSSDNPYYLAISGTSMATPHVSGAVALLWQAAPSMRVSEVRQDAGVVTADGSTYTVGPPPEGDKYGNLAYTYPEWMNQSMDTRIHESELILKLTADYIPAQGSAQSGMNGQTSNYVPDWSVPGMVDGRDHDFSQGYGLINVQRAVGLALALEQLRTSGHPEATVMDAFSAFGPMFQRKEVSADTDTLQAHWRGEWTVFNDQSKIPQRIMPVNANQTKYVYIPQGASGMNVSLSYKTVDMTELQVTNLQFLVDLNDDGSWDYTSSAAPSTTGTRTETVPLSGDLGRYVRFGVQGRAVKVPRPFRTKQFEETRAEYTMSVSIAFPSGAGTIVVPEQDHHAIVAQLTFGPRSGIYTGGNISLMKDVYDLTKVVWNPAPPPTPRVRPRSNPLLWAIVLLALIVVSAAAIAKAAPDSRPGRMVRMTARALRVPEAIGVARRGVARVGKVVSNRRGS
jgi:serine protease AprX